MTNFKIILWNLWDYDEVKNWAIENRVPEEDRLLERYFCTRLCTHIKISVHKLSILLSHLQVRNHFSSP